jgi:hypothetical protein
MRWSQFVRYSQEKSSFDHLDYARAFSVPGQSVVDKFVYFKWIPSADRPNLVLTTGIYRMQVLLDQSTSANKLKVFNSEFELSEADIDFLDNELANKTPGALKITLKNYEPENVMK